MSGLLSGTAKDYTPISSLGNVAENRVGSAPRKLPRIIATHAREAKRTDPNLQVVFEINGEKLSALQGYIPPISAPLDARATCTQPPRQKEVNRLYEEGSSFKLDSDAQGLEEIFEKISGSVLANRRYGVSVMGWFAEDQHLGMAPGEGHPTDTFYIDERYLRGVARRVNNGSVSLKDAALEFCRHVYQEMRVDINDPRQSAIFKVCTLPVFPQPHKNSAASAERLSPR
jgi:hypothetical protein